MNIVGQALDYIKNGSESSVKSLQLDGRAAENLDFERAAKNKGQN